MSKRNTRPRTFNTRTTYRTVIHPNVQPNHGMFPGLQMRDFIAVPRLATQGEWPIAYMLPDEQLVHLAVMANHMQPKRTTYADRFAEKHAAKVAADKARKVSKHAPLLGGWL